MAGGLAALTAASAVVTFSSAAQAGTPPTGPGNIEIFNKRSMVALEGYAGQAGQEATVEVIRGTETIGIGTGTIDATGFLEFNHPGGECWIGVTPNIKPGDEVKVSFSGEAFTDSAITMSPTVTKVEGSGFAPSGVVEAGDPENRVRGTGTVTIRGTYDPDDEWFDPARFNIETVNPDNDDDKTPPGEDPGLSDNRAMGISLVPDAEHPNGEAGLWDATATADATTGEIVGTYTLYTQADYDRVLEGDHVFAAWMAGEEPALGMTQNEFEEIPGPGMGGCPASPDGQVPTAPTSAQLSSAVDSTSVDVTWETPAQAADAPAVSGYRVAAVGGAHAEQEVAERTGGNTVSLEGLEAGVPYEIKIEAFNGQWSAQQSLGTITVGSGTGVGTPTGGGTGGGVTPATAPAAPAGVAAAANADGGADVSWTAATDAASYTVTATSTAAGAATPAPVTVQAPETKATLTGLTPGTAYTVSVTATNAAGPSATAGTSTVTTNPAVAPKAFDLTRVITGHESISAEWSAAAPGNAASTVTGYDVVATPQAGSPAGVTEAKATVTGLTGTVTGLRNGVSYAVSVVAKSGTATTTATKPASVNNVVKPNDVVTVARAQYRSDRREYRISGTAADVTQNRVHLRIGTSATGTVIQLNVPVAADGTWLVDLRNGPTLPTNNQFTVRSDSGAVLTTTMTRSR